MCGRSMSTSCAARERARRRRARCAATSASAQRPPRSHTPMRSGRGSSGSASDSPVITSNAASDVGDVAPSGPECSSDQHRSGTPSVGTRPNVALQPTTPHSAPGRGPSRRRRCRARSARRPAATAAPIPTTSRRCRASGSYGLRAVPWCTGSRPLGATPSSCMLVLPRSTAPARAAARPPARRASPASCRGTRSRRWCGCRATSYSSLTAIGTPSSGESGAPGAPALGRRVGLRAHVGLVERDEGAHRRLHVIERRCAAAAHARPPRAGRSSCLPVRASIIGTVGNRKLTCGVSSGTRGIYNGAGRPRRRSRSRAASPRRRARDSSHGSGVGSNRALDEA